MQITSYYFNLILDILTLKIAVNMTPRAISQIITVMISIMLKYLHI